MKHEVKNSDRKIKKKIENFFLWFLYIESVSRRLQKVGTAKICTSLLYQKLYINRVQKAHCKEWPYDPPGPVFLEFLLKKPGFSQKPGFFSHTLDKKPGFFTQRKLFSKLKLMMF
jgi:hypothetical protein